MALRNSGGFGGGGGEVCGSDAPREGTRFSQDSRMRGTKGGGRGAGRGALVRESRIGVGVGCVRVGVGEGRGDGRGRGCVG